LNTNELPGCGSKLHPLIKMEPEKQETQEKTSETSEEDSEKNDDESEEDSK